MHSVKVDLEKKYAIKQQHCVQSGFLVMCYYYSEIVAVVDPKNKAYN